ncbi:TNF receptor-associated factor 1 isoform X1 [Danaus plexippus]|uniref:TNF receptor-associated factor 1 isoform X1 n=1 Tax=Danaus plexippus TaxID=13037 RepID=UPI002AAF29A2|nr:TNF receptor-associated factor 1 isoform X1 [Danaus plexippus]
MSIKRIEADVDDRARDSACYFCNEMFEMGKLQNHLKQCGSILEQCPLRCGAWIQRKHKDTHVKDCPQMVRNREAVSPSHVRASDPVPPHEGTPTVHTWTPHSIPLEDCVSYLEKEITSIKLILTEESSHRDVQSTEIDNLRSKLVLVEERAQHFLSTLVSLRAAVDDEAERSANWAAQFKHDLANVQLALQELQSQQMNTAMRLESVVNSLVHEQRERELLEQAMTDHDNRIRSIKALEEAVNYLKQTIEEERQRNEENQIGLMGEMVGGRLAIDRLAVLEVASADARAEASEQTAKMDLVSRDLRALTKSYHKLRNELIDFQSKVSLDNPELGGDNGHLIWRIDNFQARMKEAKEKDSVLTSPLFRTSKYGYTLKAELNLNGIGKWKGRHLTCTLRLVAGPYDQLLDWPCDLTINIVLKDQPANRSQATDVVKTLDLRRKSSSKRHDYDISGDDKTRSTESLDLNVIQMKKQYIFIPHTSLDKFEYIKNDIMFLEFIVNQ